MPLFVRCNHSFHSVLPSLSQSSLTQAELYTPICQIPKDQISVTTVSFSETSPILSSICSLDWEGVFSCVDPCKLLKFTYEHVIYVVSNS